MHPQDPNKLIKVHLEGHSPDELWSRASWWTRQRKRPDQFNESLSDWRVLSSLPEVASLWAHLPRCYGWVMTDRGPGLVQELLRDPDGLISQAFTEYLWTNGYDRPAQLAVDELAADWKTGNVPTHHLGLHNMVARRLPDGALRLYVIDGFGFRHWFSGIDRLPFVMRNRLKRRLRQLRTDIEHLLHLKASGDGPGKYGFLLSRG